MGVSGSGKTTLGLRLADHFGWPFKEGDELHPPANVAKMSRGVPLDDADRAPWLAAIAAWIDGWASAQTSGVITCSALKRAYRRTLVEGRPQVRFVYLQGDEALLAKRIAGRTGHFMPADLLASQLADLEPPTAQENPIVVDIALPLERQVRVVAEALTERAG
jgi:carbohydrate kinase (thermoresistant glucokinase family)